MNYKEFVSAIEALRPDAKYIARDGDPLEGEEPVILEGKKRGIKWLDPRPMPTVAEIQAKHAELLANPPVPPRVKGLADLDAALARIQGGPMADALSAIRSLL